MIYAANFEAVRALIGFMVRDCCSPAFASIREDTGSGSSIIELASCCEPAGNTPPARRPS